jgi:outer membrane protein OmpA-like peptidoglycan-associated protein
MKLKHFNVLLVVTVVSSLLLSASASNLIASKRAEDLPRDTKRKLLSARLGDNAYDMFDFYTAVKQYNVALKKKKQVDSLHIVQRLADSYRQLNDPFNAEIWYGKLIEMGDKTPANRFWYAEMLRSNQKYEQSRKNYLEYKKDVPGDPNVADILEGLDRVKELSKDYGAYKIDLMEINSKASDFGPAFFPENQLLFTSNRFGKMDNSYTDNWSSKNFYQIYMASVSENGGTQVSKVKTISPKKPNGRFHDGPAVFFPKTAELVFTRSNYVNSKAKTSGDKKTVMLKVYSMNFPRKSKKDKLITPPFNSNDYSVAHPALNKTGDTIYFSSNMLGGRGGTDLYLSTFVGGDWTAPVNLGSEINSRFEEKFPYVAANGDLYFSSNAYGGLGGLDIYKTRRDENGKWTKPENLGAPVNSNRDDFTFIINDENKIGYFASNREGGYGDDDIYHFTYDEDKIDYKVTIKIIDAKTKKPIEIASILPNCIHRNKGDLITDAKGEKVLRFLSGTDCDFKIIKVGYKTKSVTITPKDKNKVVVVELEKEMIRLIVSVKDQETMKPLRDVAVSIRKNGQPILAFATGRDGTFETTIEQGSYNVFSPDYSLIRDKFNAEDADPVTNIIRKEFLIPRNNLVVNVPLTANCFSSTVTITDIESGLVEQVMPNDKEEVRFDLRKNHKYAIEHNGRVDTISTYGLRPGSVIEGPCKFVVGQTWILNNIYYDLDKWAIRLDASRELDDLVTIMKENPTIKIDLSSHTDCRQTAKYNQFLSQQRAKAATDYLVKRGINQNRVKYQGYGESRLVNTCACEPTNESSCLEEEHQENRRTEVTVTHY